MSRNTNVFGQELEVKETNNLVQKNKKVLSNETSN